MSKLTCYYFAIIVFCCYYITCLSSTPVINNNNRGIWKTNKVGVIKKCCKHDEAMLMVNGTLPRTCQLRRSNLVEFKPKIYNEFMQQIEDDGQMKIEYGRKCYGYRVTEDRYKLLLNGSLHYDGLHMKHHFCMDVFDHPNDELSDISAIICKKDDENGEPYPNHMMWIGMIISIPFMIAVVVFIVIHKKELITLHERGVVCYLCSLIVAYILWIVAQKLKVGFICISIPYIMQFSFLASFFWLNVMCFDLWWTFSGYRSFHGSAKEKERKKFFVYSLYAWGCPLIISLITLAVEYWSVIPKSIIRPGFGVSSCWFDKATKWSVFIYFYLPISIILIANTCMFISTSLIIIKHAKETKVFKRQGSKRHNENEKQRFYVYLKLFIVMGVNWIMEVISWLVGGPDYLWYITDVGNTLQGVLIFFIFVCKKRILRLLNRKICPKYEWFPMKRGSGSTTGTTVASISDTKDSRIRMDSVDLGTNSTPDVHM